MLQMKQRFFNMNDLPVFNDAHAQKTLFYESQHSAGAVWCLKPGQSLPCHTHQNADDVWIVLQGKGTFFTNDGVKKRFKLAIFLFLFQVMHMG